MARLGSAHGIQGRIRAELLAGEWVHLLTAYALAAYRSDGKHMANVRIERIALGDEAPGTGGKLVLAFVGARTRKDAARLTGGWLAVQAGPDRPLAAQIAGADACDEKGTKLGAVSDEWGAIAVHTADGRTEIPVGRLRTIDLRTRRIVVRTA